MKRMIIALSFLIVFSCLSVLMPNKTYACSCVTQTDPVKAVEASKAVFAGKVLAIKNKVLDIEGILDQKVAVLFDVEQTWKGIDQSQVVVLTNLGSPSCGYNFELGQSYLVFASGYDHDDSGLGTSICSLTGGLAGATEKLAKLGPGNKPTEIVSLHGEMDRMALTNKLAYLTAVWHRLARYHVGEVILAAVIVLIGLTVLVKRKRKH